MKKEADKNLQNLPDEFRLLFSRTTDRLRNYGQAIQFFESSILLNDVVFRAEFENDAEKYNTGVMFRDMNEVLVNRIGKYIEDQR